MNPRIPYGGIEAGGTKFCCIAAHSPTEIVARARIETTTPAETMPRVLQFFAQHPVRSLGLACFGPIDVDPNSPDFGNITNTPKRAWKQFPILRHLATSLNVPVGFHTDVVGAALAEQRWGAARECHSVLYMTVGTGIGAGFVFRGRPIDTRLHGELGHVFVPRHPMDRFAGVCPYHGDCLEGLASGPAIEQRTGIRAELLPADHEVWEFERTYLSTAIVNYIFTLAPDRIVLGGGVAHRPGLIDGVREATLSKIGGYGSFASLANRVNDYLVPPALGEDSGSLGGVALAMDALAKASGRAAGDRAETLPRWD
jgi:fructokinase